MILRKITSIALITCTLVACGESQKKEENNEPVNEVTETTLETTSELTTEMPSKNSETKTSDTRYGQKVEKINTITKNYNVTSSNAFKAYENYINVFGDDPSKFTEKEAGDQFRMGGTYVLNELDDAMAITVLEDLNPYMENFKNAGLAFAKSINEANMYYKMSDYDTDGFEKGKAMHRPIIEGFEEFYVADSILRIHSDKALEAIDAEYLEILKRDGLTLQYLTKKAVDDATKIVIMLSETEYDNLDADKLKALHAPLRTTFDELTALKTDDPKTYNVDPKISFFYSRLESLVLASTALQKRIKEKRPFSMLEKRNLAGSEFIASHVEGSPQQVSGRYSDMIESYNSLN